MNAKKNWWGTTQPFGVLVRHSSQQQRPSVQFSHSPSSSIHPSQEKQTLQCHRVFSHFYSQTLQMKTQETSFFFSFQFCTHFKEMFSKIQPNIFSLLFSIFSKNEKRKCSKQTGPKVFVFKQVLIIGFGSGTWWWSKQRKEGGVYW